MSTTTPTVPATAVRCQGQKTLRAGDLGCVARNAPQICFGSDRDRSGQRPAAAMLASTTSSGQAGGLHQEHRGPGVVRAGCGMSGMSRPVAAKEPEGALLTAPGRPDQAARIAAGPVGSPASLGYGPTGRPAMSGHPVAVWAGPASSVPPCRRPGWAVGHARAFMTVRPSRTVVCVAFDRRYPPYLRASSPKRACGRSRPRTYSRITTSSAGHGGPERSAPRRSRSARCPFGSWSPGSQRCFATTARTSPRQS